MGSKAYVPTRGAFKGRRFASKQAYRNEMARAKGFTNATERRIRQNVKRGMTVQQARGHAKGDRGKVATKQRGSRYSPNAAKLTPTPVLYTSEHARGQTGFEYYVFPYQRDPAEHERMLESVTRGAEALYADREGKNLLYRFVYLSEKYAATDILLPGKDEYASSGYAMYRPEWQGGFIKRYNDARRKSLEGTNVHYIVFSYTR